MTTVGAWSLTVSRTRNLKKSLFAVYKIVSWQDGQCQYDVTFRHVCATVVVVVVVVVEKQ
jgi:hypothetical protein